MNSYSKLSPGFPLVVSKSISFENGTLLFDSIWNLKILNWEKGAK